MVTPPERMIAERQFLITGSSQQKVWDVLATVILQQLPLQQLDIVGLDRFNAVLKLRIGFIAFSLDVEGKLIDVSRPTSYGCVILLKKGPVRLGVRVAVALRPVAERKVEVSCVAMEKGKGTIIGRILSVWQRNFALNVFDSIGARLRQLCS